MPLPSCLMQYGNVYRLSPCLFSCKSNFFSCERFCFKTEATGNSDMACYYINSYVDETVLCNHIHIRSVKKNFHVVPFTMLPMVVLILNSNRECDHLNDKI